MTKSEKLAQKHPRYFLKDKLNEQIPILGYFDSIKFFNNPHNGSVVLQNLTILDRQIDHILIKYTRRWENAIKEYNIKKGTKVIFNAKVCEYNSRCLRFKKYGIYEARSIQRSE